MKTRYLTVKILSDADSPYLQLEVDHSGDVNPPSIALSLLEREFARLVIEEDVNPIEVVERYQKALTHVMEQALKNLEMNYGVEE